MNPAAQQCRRCTECVGEQHHFLEPELGAGDAIVWPCKHCDFQDSNAECERCGADQPQSVMQTRPDGREVCSFCAEVAQ